jgi:Ser/Thr protein kinase RdoA (MazF antagonist)
MTENSHDPITVVPDLAVLESAKYTWNLTGELNFIRYNENYIYQSRLTDQDVILRITHKSHRLKSELEAELDFVNFLALNGVQVAQPYPSSNGNLVETLFSESNYCASVFQKAEGASPRQPEEFSAELLRDWGALLGKMHRLTKKYRPKNALQRKPWQEDAGFLLISRNIAPTDDIAYRRFIECKEWIASLDKNTETYGLIHCDLHHGNFFVHKGTLTAFDFDDSAYHYFVYDFSAIMCGLIAFYERQSAVFDYRATLDCLLQGYERENLLAPIWQERIPMFIEWRWVVLYHWLSARLKTEHFSTEKKSGFIAFQQQCRGHIREQVMLR